MLLACGVARNSQLVNYKSVPPASASSPRLRFFRIEVGIFDEKSEAAKPGAAAVTTFVESPLQCMASTDGG